eukprot:Blabericola_migrator_1__4072@NODE_223_length_11158_cov_141_106032_g189_i0_p6_GENE_NODE_223_length_11158_cov_141_106032_g189_i0NODE_223_length_11158_cov_141_106032_g189_i0_p6_ORF_typecomplete_len273_score20_74_NODE_223_length_11158_cov_141_106032_g189_i01016610984
MYETIANVVPRRSEHKNPCFLKVPTHRISTHDTVSSPKTPSSGSRLGIKKCQTESGSTGAVDEEELSLSSSSVQSYVASAAQIMSSQSSQRLSYSQKQVELPGEAQAFWDVTVSESFTHTGSSCRGDDEQSRENSHESCSSDADYLYDKGYTPLRGSLIDQVEERRPVDPILLYTSGCDPTTSHPSSHRYRRSGHGSVQATHAPPQRPPSFLASLCMFNWCLRGGAPKRMPTRFPPTDQRRPLRLCYVRREVSRLDVVKAPLYTETALVYSV